VIALDAASGAERWTAKVPNEVIARPAVGQGLVVVRSNDGRITAFDAASGERRWFWMQDLPSLTVRGNAPVALAPGVVFVGISGLGWSDVTAEDTPTLYSLTGDDAAASLTVRTVRSRTCVIDGWLTVGAGRRATDLFDSDGDDLDDRWCRETPAPESDGPDGDVTIPRWDELRAEQEEHGYDTRLGLVGDQLADAGVCTTAVGPGAALALADGDGNVDRYVDTPTAVDSELIDSCRVTAIDLGGPINKAAGFVAFSFTTDHVLPVTARSIAIVIPPIGLGLATIIDRRLTGKRLFNAQLYPQGKTAMFLAFMGISEGAIPFALESPITAIPSYMVGAIVGSTAAVWLGAVQWFPESAIWAWPLVTNLGVYMAGIALGAIITALMVVFLRLMMFRKGKLLIDSL